MWYDLLSLLSIVISQNRAVNDTDSQCLTEIVGKIAPLSQFLQIKINSSLNSHAGGFRFCLRWRNGRCATIRDILSILYFMTFSAFCVTRSPVFIFKELAWLRESVDLWKWVFKNDIIGVKKIFPWIPIWKMDMKISFMIITKNHAADSKIWFLTRWISKPYGRATAMPPAWDLNLFSFYKESRGLIL